jgi:hypothetical protein
MTTPRPLSASAIALALLAPFASPAPAQYVPAPGSYYVTPRAYVAPQPYPGAYKPQATYSGGYVYGQARQAPTYSYARPSVPAPPSGTYLPPSYPQATGYRRARPSHYYSYPGFSYPGRVYAPSPRGGGSFGGPRFAPPMIGG